MRNSPTTAVGAALVLAATAGALPAQAATPSAIAAWSMDEPNGAAVMVDDAGAYDGDIGTEVVTGIPVSGTSRAYRFTRLKPNEPPAHPEHNVVVPHSPELNPGTRSLYVVEVRYRTTNAFGNIVQKGQAGSKGGYWKIQLPQGEPSCLFRGPAGETNAVRARGVKLNDGEWHTVRCEATPSETRLYVDDAYVGRNGGTTGTIANTKALAIGGKDACDQITVTCDYFGGDIDYVRIEGAG